MKDAFRQSMAWLHTWGGLLVGWLLFFMFLTGTTGYVDTEIDHWMRPEWPLAYPQVAAGEAVAGGLRHLQAVAPEAEEWSLFPPHGREGPWLRVGWRARPEAPGERGAFFSETLDPATGEILAARKTGGARLLYRMHYQFHYLPLEAAYWIAGFCAMVMLVALVTGVIIHKRIFRDFFTFRPGLGQRAWLDAHNVAGVLALPFFLMITYSGLLFFAERYMAPVVAATYGSTVEAREEFGRIMFSDPAPDGLARANVPAPLAPLGPLVAEAERRWGAGHVRYIDIRYPGDANARIHIAAGPETPSRSHGSVTYHGVSGALLGEHYVERSLPKVLIDTLLGLHEGLFAGPALRWLYFLSGLMGTAMVGTGLLLWTAKRRTRLGTSRGFAWVERLNITVVAGLPTAIAAYLWANRLFPAGFAGRAPWEAHAMFLVWAALLIHPVFRPPRRAWAEQLGIAAAAYALLPLVNALTTDRHLGVTLPHGAWDLAGVDLVALAIGLAFAAAAWRVRKRAGAAT